MKIVNVILCSLIGLKNYLGTKYLEDMSANTPSLGRSYAVCVCMMSSETEILQMKNL